MLKNIKLVEKPEFDILVNQLHVLKKNINAIIEQKDVVDILLEPLHKTWYFLITK